MAKTVKKIYLMRYLVQLILFFLLPGLYIMAFSELKVIYQMIIKGDFNLLQALQGSAELFAVILLTVILGRFFCGWVCAFGAYNDLIYGISRKLFKMQYKVNDKLDSVLKYLKYVVLVLIAAIAWTMGSTVFSTVSPWDAFAQITNFPQVISAFAIGFLLLVLITIGALFIKRFFCRYLCPLGAVFTLFSKLSLFKISKPKDQCGKCRACTANCSMGIPLYKVNEVKGGECINCLKCVEICPRNNAATNIIGVNVNPALMSVIAIVAFAGIYGGSQLGASAVSHYSGGLLPAAQTPVKSVAKSQVVKYKDGTYTGTGTGFSGGTTKVSVTIKNGIITSVHTISSQDTPDFYHKAENVIPNEIMSAQSASVDTVSGATYSSNGIIGAVKDALSKAV